MPSPQAQPNWLHEIHRGSTLADLPGHPYRVTSGVRAQFAVDEFERRSDLPGVIVEDDGAILGVISRANCLELLSQPFGHELFLGRPIRQMLQAINAPSLVLPPGLGIHDAAQNALSRPTEHVFEPIIVSGSEPRLVDAHVLLRAQSTLLELANDTIREQVRAAEAASVAKSQFLANMSHEIRTPLTAILGFAENLLDEGLTPDDRTQAAGTIVRNGRHLLQVINDILDLAKIEAGKIDCERLRISPVEIVSDVVSVLRVRAEARQLALRAAFHGPVPETIESDPTRLRQILMNLVGNAIKFTEQGSVELRVRVQSQRRSPSGRPAGRALLQFDVIDTGIGMTVEQIDRLFRPFVQADGSTTRRFGGTGLGLSISRQLAQLLGGDVCVSSEPGKGSAFHLTIDAGDLDDCQWIESPQLALAAPVKVESIEPLPPCRILLAEDSPDNQLLIRKFLERLGATVTIAANGRQAVDLAMESRERRAPFDLIFMDMQMPVLDGYAATAELRQRGYAGAIVALTANAMGDDYHRCLQSGCDDYATKPIARARLAAQIHRVLTPSANPHPASSPAAGSDDRGPADISSDDVFDRQLALERCGNERELFREVVEVFLETTPAEMSRLQRAVAANDLRTAQRVAHTLKGSAETLGGRLASRAAQCIEAFAKNDDGRSCAPLLGTLTEELDALSHRLREEIDATRSVSEETPVG